MCFINCNSLNVVEKRKDEIAIEVSRKVDAAKKQMEREMMLELEKNLQNTRNKEKQREVSFPFNSFPSPTFFSPPTNEIFLLLFLYIYFFFMFSKYLRLTLVSLVMLFLNSEFQIC